MMLTFESVTKCKTTELLGRHPHEKPESCCYRDDPII
jgi:hypothetical protein